MSLLPTSTVTTNELKLHDFKGAKASLTFGDADINDGYSYLRLNFRANDYKFDFWQDKPVLNFIAEEAITFNDKKIWHEDNDGPMSGLNADMLDGLHASELKDRSGHHHFGHAFAPGGEKKFVKIATFTPRRVGNAPDFNTNGTVPFQGIFTDNIVKRMEARARFEAFKEDTPERLGPIGINGFEHTDMASEGVYNATLRASISLLKKGETNAPPWQGPETVDVHVGIFEDPTNENIDGWSCTSKYFYISCHERNIPFIKENDDPNHDYLVGGNVKPIDKTNKKVNVRDTAVEEKGGGAVMLAAITQSEDDHPHSRPPVDCSDYATPPDPSKNDYISQIFPPVIDPGFGYQKHLEGFRLYHAQSFEDILDGVKVVTHRFELYMAVDTKMEVHVQPYMSSSCVFYNYQKPLSESELPQGQYLRPYSIYDNRYSHVEHRHRNYEGKIEKMDSEIEEIWSVFDEYVCLDQGKDNASKVMMTDSTGKVVAVKDNFERHQDNRRHKERVLVTNKDGCISEAGITTKELAQLDNVRSNIQDQIDELDSELDKMPDGNAFVKKVGDSMTGHLRMKNGAEVKVENVLEGSFYANADSIGLYDNIEGKSILNYSNEPGIGRVVKFPKHTVTLSDKRLTISPSAPPNPKVGDIWIKNM